MKPETVTFTKVVEIADADGVAIREGSVLREINDGARGVVRRIIRPGDSGTLFDCVGDVQIRVSPGHTRVTNNYNQWRHIPHSEQTYQERLESWLQQPFVLDPYKHAAEDEQRATEGIMALLPEDAVDWEYGPCPDRLEDALQFLATHLTDARNDLRELEDYMEANDPAELERFRAEMARKGDR